MMKACDWVKHERSWLVAIWGLPEWLDGKVTGHVRARTEELARSAALAKELVVESDNFSVMPV